MTAPDDDRPADSTEAAILVDEEVPPGARLGRVGLAVVGVAAGLWGLRLLLQALSFDALIRMPLWLGGAVV
ncbi:MAG: hypothetical protein QOF58_8848, partial [Pseudonocardiales bacterium]|nr:hypothetical protein [Pseudonocardiales bacterium]